MMFRRGGGGTGARSPLAHRNNADDDNHAASSSAQQHSSRLHLFRGKFGTTPPKKAGKENERDGDEDENQEWHRHHRTRHHHHHHGRGKVAGEDVKGVERQQRASSSKREKHGTVCPDIIKEYRETTSARSLTENEIQINEEETTKSSNSNIHARRQEHHQQQMTTPSLKNSYKKMKLLGKGGFAVVYSVKDLKYAKAGSAKGGGGGGEGGRSRSEREEYSIHFFLRVM